MKPSTVDDYTNFVNATCTTNQYNLKRSIVPNLIPSLYNDKNISILDYGSGRNAWHSRYLISLGYNVTAYEIGKNFNDLYHSKTSLKSVYDVVYASNVLNVQPNVVFLKTVLSEIEQCTSDNGSFICNYPYSPRKNKSISTNDMKAYLKSYFKEVKPLPKVSSPTWICRK